MKQSRTSRLY